MIIQQSSIIIERDHKAVLCYISDLANDSQWRAEIIRTQRKGTLQLGQVVFEESILSKKVPFYLRKLTCCSYLPETLVAYQSSPEDPHFLRSTRSVRAMGPGHTEFSYLLEFDPSIVKLAMGFSLPRFLINLVTKRSMKSYLKKLKLILEEKGGS